MTSVKRTQTSRYLEVLSSALEDDEVFTFQTFDDNRERKNENFEKQQRDPFAKIIHRKWNWRTKKLLDNLNEQGVGIHVALHRTDLKGRKNENIVSLRCFVIDCDDIEIDESKFPIAPNIIVQSKAGKHYYWLVDPKTELGLFKPVQIALSRKFGVDEQVCKLNQTLRIPGFNHCKQEPHFHVELLRAEEGFIQAQEFIEAFELELPDLSTQYKSSGARKIYAGEVPLEDRIRRCQAYLDAIGPAIGGTGTGAGHKKTLSAVLAGWDFAVPEPDFLPMLFNWGYSCDPPWRDDHLEREFRYSKNWRTGDEGQKLESKISSSAQKEKSLVLGALSSPSPDREDWFEEDPAASSFTKDADFLEEEAQDDGAKESIPWDHLRPSAIKMVVNAEERIKKYEEEIRQKEKKKKPKKNKKSDDESERIGVCFEETDQILDFSDSGRQPQVMASYLNREYDLRRDDARCIYVCNGTFWEETSVEYVHKLCMQYTSFAEAEMSDIREAASLALTRRHIRRIDWNQLSQTEIAFSNGILDFESGEMREHAPDNYLDRIVPVDYDKDALCPLWEKCLNDWLPDRPEDQHALQLFFGYMLMSHALYKKCLILYGDPDTGKSQVCYIAKELAGGDRFVCGIHPSDMDDPRKLAPIKGKALNLIEDLPKNTVLADGGFKRLVSTGDSIQIDQKFTRAENYVPSAKHLFATNNLPVVTDATGAVFKRLLILHFKNVIPVERQNRDLPWMLRNEMPGICAWAVRGAKRLYEMRGVWPEISSSKNLIDEYKLDQNPVHDFLEESGMVIKDPNSLITVEEVTNFFNEYRKGQKPWSKRAVRERLDALGYHQGERRFNKRTVKGLRSKEDQPALFVVHEDKTRSEKERKPDELTDYDPDRQ